MSKPAYKYCPEMGCGTIDNDGKQYFMDIDDMTNVINFSKRFVFQRETDVYPSFHYNEQTVNYLTFLYGFKERKNGGNVTYNFKNGNPNDLRRSNVEILHDYHETVIKNFHVVQYTPGHFSKNGTDPYQMKNPMWRVIDDESGRESLLMYCEPGILCKLCDESFGKIEDYQFTNRTKLTWFRISNGYVAAWCAVQKKQFYIHQIITGCFGNGRGTKTVSVDHIDRDTLNNRWDNLRIATRKEQEDNTRGIAPDTKRARKSSAKELPEGITKDMFRKYVVYYHEFLNAEKTRFREFFKIERHPKLNDRIIIGTKAKDVPLLEKLRQINKIADDLDQGIIPPESNKGDSHKNDSETQKDMKEENQHLLELFEIAPPSPSYIAGLIDGDGTVFIRQIRDGYQSGIEVSQSRTNVLQILRYHYGGKIVCNVWKDSRNEQEEDGIHSTSNRRKQYQLFIRSGEYKFLLDDLRDALIVKSRQMSCLQEIARFVNKVGHKQEKHRLFEECRDLNSKDHASHYDDAHIRELCGQRLNAHYIAGLFDAEGCIYIGHDATAHKFYISITQKTYPVLLEMIREFLGFGNIDGEKRFKIYSKDHCLRFLEIVDDFLIVKKAQSKAMTVFLQTDDATTKESMYAITNREKHASEDFEDTASDDVCKAGYLRRLMPPCCKRHAKWAASIEDRLFCTQQLLAGDKCVTIRSGLQERVSLQTLCNWKKTLFTKGRFPFHESEVSAEKYKEFTEKLRQCDEQQKERGEEAEEEGLDGSGSDRDFREDTRRMEDGPNIQSSSSSEPVVTC